MAIKKYNINIGDIYEDMQCVDIIKKRHDGKYNYTNYYYVMMCTKCGRVKEMLGSTIVFFNGTSHKSCGKGLKTADRTFYSRWEAMRTRTTNPNYQHADRYSKRGINSDAFKLFIDFFDALFTSYLEMSKKIGPENTSLERIDYDKNYCPENCMWIHKRDQPKNSSRVTKFIAIYPDGHEEICKNVLEFSRKHGMAGTAIQDCLHGRSKSAKGFKFKPIV